MSNVIPEVSAKKGKERKPRAKKEVYKSTTMDFRAFLDGENGAGNTEYVSVSVSDRRYNLTFSDLETENIAVIHGNCSKKEYFREIGRLNVILLVLTELIKKVSEYKNHESYKYMETWTYRLFLNGNLPGSNAACVATITLDGFTFIVSDCRWYMTIKSEAIDSEDAQLKAILRMNVIFDALTALTSSLTKDFQANATKLVT